MRKTIVLLCLSLLVGDRRYDKADIVIVSSILEDGEYRVYDIGSFEPYAWHTACADCIDRARFKD